MPSAKLPDSSDPTQLLCTLRGRRCRRLTQHSLPGGPLRPYPDRSSTGWTAPAFLVLVCWRLRKYRLRKKTMRRLICGIALSFLVSACAQMPPLNFSVPNVGPSTVKLDAEVK